MKTVQLTVEYPEHDKLVLTNERGDTYTSKSEELADFLHDLKDCEQPQQIPPTEDSL